MQPPVAHATDPLADEAHADSPKQVAREESTALKRKDIAPQAVPLAPDDARDAARQAKPKELWIAVHLPWIPLEALQAEPIAQRMRTESSRQGAPVGRRAQPGAADRSVVAQPIAVVELIARAQYVVAANQLARRGGVRPGMTLAAALALVPELQAKPRDPRREQVLLEQLATHMQRFTSRVSIVPPDGLVLEVKGSLKLFGGAKKLGQAVIAECLSTGARPVIALAPTPLAALAGARGGKTFIVMDGANLIGQLAALPLAVLRWPMEVIDRLTKIGVRSIGEALRLPRAGFARRFGKDQLTALDQLAGRLPDLRKEFRARERFRKRRDLTYDIEHYEGVLEVLEPLLQELEKFLRGRQSGITRLECRLKHRHAPATRCLLKLAAPEMDAKRLKALFAERLPTLVLPEPVRACELRSGDLVARASPINSLWRPGEHGGEVGSESSAFIELLRARLGFDAVHSLQVFADHRPEAAWRTADPSVAAQSTSTQQATRARSVEGAAKISAHAPTAAIAAAPTPWPAFRRPLWLLPEPQPLTERDGMPRYRGPLRLIGESERIETGWWDGKDITRDYYCALDIRGVKLWIFRECNALHAWYLHGFFG
jgi:protein ImuB